MKNCRSWRARYRQGVVTTPRNLIESTGNVVDQLVEFLTCFAAVTADIGGSGMFAGALGLLVERMIPAAALGVAQTAIIDMEGNRPGERDEQDKDDPPDCSTHVPAPRRFLAMLARSGAARNPGYYNKAVTGRQPTATRPGATTELTSAEPVVVATGRGLAYGVQWLE
jgi:hypothetical protein